MRHGSSSSKLSVAVALTVSGLGGCTALPLDEHRAIAHTSDIATEIAYIEPEYGSGGWPYFTDELRTRYIALMDDAIARRDYYDYYHFRDKGYAALVGDLRGPDRVASREIPPEARRPALELRQRLLAALGAGARIEAPVAAASAEAGFDCWLAELEAGTAPDDMTSCKQTLLTALDEITVL
ncbi:MAG TPA: hypothetical protein VFG47_17245 [Geminicoccaceae bacterium]|nr:hypothetical protein [Geminicoccaceae bacterium]